MKFWREGLTVRFVCSVLVALVIAACLYAYKNSRSRQMARFENKGLVLTVEEVPAMPFPVYFLGESLSFHYRFTLASAPSGVVCSNFLIPGGSSRYTNAEELKPPPNLAACEGLLFVCALDSGLEVTCSGMPFREITWTFGGRQIRDLLKEKAAAEESRTFLDDPEWQAEEKKAAAEKMRQQMGCGD